MRNNLNEVRRKGKTNKNKMSMEVNYHLLNLKIMPIVSEEDPRIFLMKKCLEECNQSILSLIEAVALHRFEVVNSAFCLVDKCITNFEDLAIRYSFLNVAKIIYVNNNWERRRFVILCPIRFSTNNTFKVLFEELITEIELLINIPKINHYSLFRYGLKKSVYRLTLYVSYGGIEGGSF